MLSSVIIGGGPGGLGPRSAARQTVEKCSISPASSGLTRRLDEILPSGAVGAVRRIGMKDDQLLSPAESACIGRAVVARRRASGAARMLARSLLSSISKPHPDIYWSSSGAPVWPAGVVGSLAHDELVAVAIVGSAAEFGGLGLDVEPAEPLDDELISIVATPNEQSAFGDDPLQGKSCFVSKKPCSRPSIHLIDASLLSTTSWSTTYPVSRGPLMAESCDGVPLPSHESWLWHGGDDAISKLCRYRRPIAEWPQGEW